MKATCLFCSNSWEFTLGLPTTLMCQACNGKEIYFDSPVKVAPIGIGNETGDFENIQADQPFNTRHTQGNLWITQEGEIVREKKPTVGDFVNEVQSEEKEVKEKKKLNKFRR
jgi:hypothetical protein